MANEGSGLTEILSALSPPPPPPSRPKPKSRNTKSNKRRFPRRRECRKAKFAQSAASFRYSDREAALGRKLASLKICDVARSSKRILFSFARVLFSEFLDTRRRRVRARVSVRYVRKRGHDSVLCTLLH